MAINVERTQSSLEKEVEAEFKKQGIPFNFGLFQQVLQKLGPEAEAQQRQHELSDIERALPQPITDAEIKLQFGSQATRDDFSVKDFINSREQERLFELTQIGLKPEELEFFGAPQGVTDQKSLQDFQLAQSRQQDAEVSARSSAPAQAPPSPAPAPAPAPIAPPPAPAPDRAIFGTPEALAQTPQPIAPPPVAPVPAPANIAPAVPAAPAPASAPAPVPTLAPIAPSPAGGNIAGLLKKPGTTADLTTASGGLAAGLSGPSAATAIAPAPVAGSLSSGAPAGAREGFPSTSPTFQDLSKRLAQPINIAPLPKIEAPGAATESLFQKGVSGLAPSGGIRPETQRILDILEERTGRAAKRGASEAQALAGRRGVKGSSIEQFGTAEAIRAAEESGRTAEANVLLENLRTDTRFQELQSTAFLDRASKIDQITSNQEIAQLQAEASRGNQQAQIQLEQKLAEAGLTSDEIASQRNIDLQLQQLEIERILGEQGLALTRENIKQATDAARRTSRDQLVGNLTSAFGPQVLSSIFGGGGAGGGTAGGGGGLFGGGGLDLFGGAKNLFGGAANALGFNTLKGVAASGGGAPGSAFFGGAGGLTGQVGTGVPALPGIGQIAGGAAGVALQVGGGLVGARAAKSITGGGSKGQAAGSFIGSLLGAGVGGGLGALVGGVGGGVLGKTVSDIGKSISNTAKKIFGGLF